MNRGVLLAISFLVATLGLAAFSTAAEDRRLSSVAGARCPVCGMFVAPYADWNATIVFQDATRITADGPKDMFKYYLDIKKYSPSRKRADISSISVKDYYSQASIDARKAFFVLWSDVYGPMGHEPVPFEKEKDAKEFMKAHKGRKILGFRDITKKVILSLDNP